jgi:hypothetical protein
MLVISSRYGCWASVPAATDWGAAAFGEAEAFAEANMVTGSSWGRDGARDDDGLFRQRFLFRQLHRSIDCALALPFGVLKNRDREVTFLDRAQPVGRAIDTGNEHLALLARLLEGHGRADGHFIIVGDDRLEVATLGQPVIGDVHAALTLPGTGLLLRDFDVRVTFEDFLDPGRAVASRVVGQLAQQNNNVTFAVHFLGQVLHLHAAGFFIVRCHRRDACGKFGIIRATVDVDERNTGSRGDLGDAVGGFRVDGVDDQRVDLLANQLLHLVELFVHVVAPIDELQVNAAHGLGLFVHVFTHVGQVGVIELRHGHADLEVGGQSGTAAEHQGQGKRGEAELGIHGRFFSGFLLL